MYTPPTHSNRFPQSAAATQAGSVEKLFQLPGGCLTWTLASMVLAIFAGSLVPCFGCVQVRGSQTKALAQAKQIGLALRLFADDHDGNYPRQGVPVENREAPVNSNVAFAALFPTHTQSESIFGNKLCYGAKTPDNQIDSAYDGEPRETLKPGENVYGYVMGLTAKSEPSAPIIVDGTNGTGHYTRNQRKRGGVWKGEKAVVIYLDNSGALETLTGPDDARYIPRRAISPAKPAAGSDNLRYTPRLVGRTTNLLDVGYLGKDVRYLDPAVAVP